MRVLYVSFIVIRYFHFETNGFCLAKFKLIDNWKMSIFSKESMVVYTIGNKIQAKKSSMLNIKRYLGFLQ